MKQRAIIVLVAFNAIAGCVVQKDKGPYDFPVAMAADVRADYFKQCEKGRMLYENNCGKCHNMVVKGKSVVPYFSQEKLVGYALRESNEKHTSSMPDSIVTAEDLGLIMTFLTYKKKDR